MREVLPEAEKVFNWDYHARLVTILVTVLGFAMNIFHFSVLVRKSLRNSSVFIMMLVICIADFFQLVTVLIHNVKYVIDFNSPAFCIGFDTYYGQLSTVILGWISESAMLTSSTLALLMALYRCISIKFSMSSWAPTFSKSRTAKATVILVATVSFFYSSAGSALKYRIHEKNSTAYCAFSTFKGAEGMYTVVSGTGTPILVFTLIDGLIQLIQLVLFCCSSLFLVKFLRETARIRILKNREDRQNTRTEGLILFTLCSFFISTFPILLVNLLAPAIFALNYVPYFIILTATILTILQTLNAGTHGIVCVLMSSQYRDVARTAFSSRSVSGSSVAPVIEISAARSAS